MLNYLQNSLSKDCLYDFGMRACMNIVKSAAELLWNKTFDNQQTAIHKAMVRFYSSRISKEDKYRFE